MIRALSALALICWGGTAHARRLALDPENRVHVGAALTDSASFGIIGGLDSRLTRLLYVDIGGFVSPIPLPDDIAPVSDQGRDFVFLRHGLYVAPGLRVPHRQPAAFQWDLTGRAGFGAVWSNDVHPDNTTLPTERYELEATPALLAGAEALVRKDAVGVKLSARGYLFRPYSQFEKADLVLLRPQYLAEVFYQW
ncbi:MAG: hypothetical protein D6798_16395 [Deltaproteobacteria bacterium]|nr:MAG: hypothetical protein D6798_16395 [Deltaproteobacteria bacterium]